jgi:hypothetical protein
MDSLLSFPVGLFHPLQHAGLSRRSPGCRQYTRNVPGSIRVAHLSGAEAIEIHRVTGWYQGAFQMG